MTRLVVVSNRVASPGSDAAAQGGLAFAMLDALRRSGGLWFGWSGEVFDDGDSAAPNVVEDQGVTFATVGLSRADYEAFYAGFANRVLWPLFHFRMNFVHSRSLYLDGYWRVNRSFVRRLEPLLEPEDVIWVHDYHLIPMGGLLRESGLDQPIGFFLHTPFPPWDVFRALPGHQKLLRALCRYDLVGFQTRIDQENFLDCIRRTEVGSLDGEGIVRSNGYRIGTGVFPIGIDPEQVARSAKTGRQSDEGRRLVESLGGRKLIIGVDRLDYSKGLPERFHAYERLLESHPEVLGRVVFLQIAPTSRSDVPEYAEIRHELEEISGHVNSRFAEYDWVPLRYVNRGFDRETVAGFLSRACVGLVTPVRDGMNLVAKEFVASQDPEDPGVLVLSRFAGAARELDAAVLVNPYDLGQVARGIECALNMPLVERRKRWSAMMDVLRENDIHAWRQRFLDALVASRDWSR